MKALRILLLIAIMVISAGTAMAVTVTLQGSASGTYTLQSMTIDSNGNITLSVSSSTPPPPGALTLSLSPTSLPAGTVGQSYNQSVTMTATGGTSPYTYACSGSGVSGISASASGNICTISGTPTTSGNYTVNFTATDSANATASQSLVFSVNASTPPGGSYIDITTSGRLPNYLKSQSIAPFNQSTNTPGAAYYGFTTTDPNFKKVAINLEAEIDSTGAYTADMDLFVSTTGQPSCSYNNRTTIGASNETIIVTNRTATGALLTLPPATYYITICNFTQGVTGKFRLSWAGYY